MSRPVASSRSGAMLFQGYRVRLAQPKRPEPQPLVGIIKRIGPGEVVEVDWPGLGVTLHRGHQLTRMGTARENELHPETRAGYPVPETPEPEVLIEGGTTDPLERLLEYGRVTLGHVTIHANFGVLASRSPDPDWTCQLVWATGQPEEPLLSFYGYGTSLVFAAAQALAQIDARLAALAADDGEEA
jgi:hypothetical protein